MKCDKCDNEATIHEVMIRSGKRVERHLCEGCARDSGVAGTTIHTPLTQLLSQYITSQVQPTGGAESSAAPGKPGSKAVTCPTCSLSFGQFRQTGLLGCPDCYEAFEGQLGPLLSRAHDGGTSHVGKIPVRLRPEGPAGAPALAAAATRPAALNTDRILTLRRQLTEAVAAEQYERAAKLRDELARLESPSSSPRAKATRKSAPRKLEGDA